MDPEEIEQLQPVADIHEQTENTSERLRVLCQLAESLDEDEIRSLKDDADNAYAFPSLSGMDKATALTVLERIEAVQDFREELEEIHGRR